MAPAPSSAPLMGYPADSSGPGYYHSAALACCRQLLGRQIRILIGLTNAVTGEEEDLGVLYEPVRDRGGNRGVVEDVSPLGEGSGADGRSAGSIRSGRDCR